MTPTLRGFCRSIAANRGLTPTGMGKDFVKFFGLTAPPTMDELRRVLCRAGVGSISDAPLPQGMRGFHYSLDAAPYTINYRKRDREWVRKQTVLHETYEIIKEMRSGRQVDPARDRRLCREADRFAKSVLRLPDMFAACAGASRPQRPRRRGSPPAGASLRRRAHSGRRLQASSILARKPGRGTPSRQVRGQAHARSRTIVGHRSGEPGVQGRAWRPRGGLFEAGPRTQVSPRRPHRKWRQRPDRYRTRRGGGGDAGKA